MASGKVKWFNNAKGYGFVNEEGKSEDLFAHYSHIQMDGYKTLKAGQSVTFDIVQGPRGCTPSTSAAPAPRHRKSKSSRSRASSRPDPPLTFCRHIGNRPAPQGLAGFHCLHMCLIISSPKPELLTNLAPSIRRSKS